jgi:alkylated DNA nucleotide flippase Atl1
VVNQKRTISPRNSGSHLVQQKMLEEEGVVFDDNGRIDFDEFLWLP